MTTSLDRSLLRWLPLAVVLAAALAIGSMLVPRPLAFDDWPKPPARGPVKRVIQPSPAAPRWSAPAAPVQRPSRSGWQSLAGGFQP